MYIKLADIQSQRPVQVANTAFPLFSGATTLPNGTSCQIFNKKDDNGNVRQATLTRVFNLWGKLTSVLVDDRFDHMTFNAILKSIDSRDHLTYEYDLTYNGESCRGYLTIDTNSDLVHFNCTAYIGELQTGPWLPYRYTAEKKLEGDWVLGKNGKWKMESS